jgi:Flp pilus assembly pilin Flp
MKSLLTSLYRSARGTSTIEFALICGMIVIAIIGAVRGLGDENGGQWSRLSSKVNAATQGTGS